MYVRVVSLDYLCRWQVKVFVYCVSRIPAHLRYIQCSILLHLMEICLLMCICLWHISQIQTCLYVFVGPGIVSTSPAFMRSNSFSGTYFKCYVQVDNCVRCGNSISGSTERMKLFLDLRCFAGSIRPCSEYLTYVACLFLSCFEHVYPTVE